MNQISKPFLLIIHATIYTGSAIFWQAHIGPEAIILAGILIWVSIVDIKIYEIPDLASLALALTGALGLWQADTYEVYDAVLAAIVWPLLFWTVARWFRQNRKLDGLGFGDVKLMVGIGMWCGFVGAIYVVFAASMGGICLILLTHFRSEGKKAKIGETPIAFGPFLCLSTWETWLSGMSM